MMIPPPRSLPFLRNEHRLARRFILLLLATSLLPACQESILRRTDRQVYRLIEDRQRAALGETSDVNIGPESGNIATSNRMYEFNPRPADPELPDAFRPADPSPEAQSPKNPTSDSADSESAPDSSDPAARPPVPPERLFGLRNTLLYADRHAREVQDAKEDLYLAALDLSLERHLWTPQFVASVQAQFVDYGQVRDFDRAMTAVSNVAVSQRLPFGGNVTARVINTLMRDLTEHATTAENGNVILEANIPLFRGAGRVAYESRYQAERELIYAVRTYERFRRAFLVSVASEYFNLQRLKSSVANTRKSYENRRKDWEKADFINRMGQSKTIFDAPRAKSSLRQAESALVSAREQYASALDRFKIFIGMPVDEPLDVLDQDADADAAALDRLLPPVDVETAVEVALRYRLDLRNDADRLDDSRRRVLVAKNRILPDLDASGSATLDTDPERLNSASYNTERTTWQGMLTLRMDDRKAERNAYRAALIATRKSERDLDRACDTVRADVRRAVRRVEQQTRLREIQAANVEENEFRLQAARAQFDLGMTTNQDVVDAETDLLAARNDLAFAIAAYRVAILEFRRDTETLKVTEDGLWLGAPRDDD